MPFDTDLELVIWQNTFDHEHFQSDSFFGQFCEEDVWDMGQYWIFEKALYELAERYRESCLPRPLQIALFDIYTRTLVRLFHYDRDPVQGLTRELCDELKNERLETIFRGVFAGYTVSPDLFTPHNPLMQN